MTPPRVCVCARVRTLLCWMERAAVLKQRDDEVPSVSDATLHLAQRVSSQQQRQQRCTSQSGGRDLMTTQLHTNSHNCLFVNTACRASAERDFACSLLYISWIFNGGELVCFMSGASLRWVSGLRGTNREQWVRQGRWSTSSSGWCNEMKLLKCYFFFMVYPFRELWGQGSVARHPAGGRPRSWLCRLAVRLRSITLQHFVVGGFSSKLLDWLSAPILCNWSVGSATCDSVWRCSI